MNLYKEQYDERKKSVLDFLDQTIAYFREHEDQQGEEALARLRQNVEDDLFGIVLVGEFSAGKSTFLNALMHRRILPSFTSETTATVNFLRHTSSAPNGEAGIVYYRDGHTEVIPELTLEEIEKVVSTRGDKGDQKIATSVDHVDLFLDSGLLQDGVMLVDSPGLNGVADHHREITEQQIKASHASIFMFSADHPGSKTDFEYLRELKSQSKNIFFVLNKINVIREQEGQSVESVVEELRQTYHTQFPDETELPKIWPVAGDAALAARDEAYSNYHDEIVSTQARRDELENLSRMEAFEERLWRYLTEGERACAQLSGPVDTGLKALQKQLEYLTAQITLLNEPQNRAEVEKQRELLENQIQTMKQERKNAAPTLRSRVSEAQRNLYEMAGKQSHSISNQITARADALESVEELRDYAGQLGQDISRRYLQIANKMDSSLREELLYVVQEEYADYFGELEDRFLEISSAVTFSFKAEKLVITEYTINSNLEQFDAWCQSVQQKIAQLEEQTDRLAKDSIEAKMKQREIDGQRAELQELKERRKDLEEHFLVPEAVYHQEDQDESHWRGGILGLIGNALFGKKHITRTVSVADTTEKDAALRQKEAEINRLEHEIETVRKELQQNQQKEQSPEALEYEYRKKQLEYMEKLEKNTARICRQIRDDIRTFVEDLEYDFQSEIEQYLQKQNRSYIQAVQDMLNASLNQELERTNQKLTALLQSMEAEGDARQQKLEAAQKDEEFIRTLMGQGAELSARLRVEMNDHVEQEAL